MDGGKTESNGAAGQAPSQGDGSRIAPRGIFTQHTVVRFTVLRAAAPCPVFHPGDVFFVRQHILDTEVSISRNFCYHTLVGLYKVFERVRRGPVGGKEVFSCRDKQMVQIEVERLPDEKAWIGRAGTSPPSPDRKQLDPVAHQSFLDT